MDCEVVSRNWNFSNRVKRALSEILASYISPVDFMVGHRYLYLSNLPVNNIMIDLCQNFPLWKVSCATSLRSPQNLVALTRYIV